MSLGSKLHTYKMYLNKESDEDRISVWSAQTYSRKESWMQEEEIKEIYGRRLEH